MAILEGSDVKGHESEKRDHFDYWGLMRDRQVRAYNLVREEDLLTEARHQAANDEIEQIMNNKTRFETGDWV